jgi:hypothetical protein
VAGAGPMDLPLRTPRLATPRAAGSAGRNRAPGTRPRRPQGHPGKSSSAQPDRPVRLACGFLRVNATYTKGIATVSRFHREQRCHHARVALRQFRPSSTARPRARRPSRAIPCRSVRTLSKSLARELRYRVQNYGRQYSPRSRYLFHQPSGPSARLPVRTFRLSFLSRGSSISTRICRARLLERDF